MIPIPRLIGCVLAAMILAAKAGAYEQPGSLTCAVIVADMDRAAQEAVQKELAGKAVWSSEELAETLSRQGAPVRAIGALASQSGLRIGLKGALSFTVEIVILPSEGETRMVSLDGEIEFEGKKVVLVGAGALRDGEARVFRLADDESRVVIVRVTVEPFAEE